MKRSRRPPKLGQHFLRGAWAARALARAAGIAKGDTVVEVGPGTGILTRELLAAVESTGGGSSSGGRVVAVEKDIGLVAKLRETFREAIASGHLRLVESDIRDFAPRSLKLEAPRLRRGFGGQGSYVVAANIPYYLTGEIIRMFLSARAQPRTMALLVQKEVAERIVNSEQKTVNRKKGKESILSISVKVYGRPRIVAKVARGNFSPPPSVDSAILAITDISRMFFRDIDERLFFKLVRAGFASKRKLLAGNLKKYGCTKPVIFKAFAHCGIPEKARAEDVPLPKWKCLAQYVVRST